MTRCNPRKFALGPPAFTPHEPAWPRVTAAPANAEPDVDNLLRAMVVDGLADPNPCHFLLVASSLVSLMERDEVHLTSVLDACAASDDVVMHGLLAAYGELLSDDAARRYAQELAWGLKTHQRKRLPTWLRRLGRTTVTAAGHCTDPTFDSTCQFLEVHIAQKIVATVFTFVDQTRGYGALTSVAVDAPLADLAPGFSDDDAWCDAPPCDVAALTLWATADSRTATVPPERAAGFPLARWASRLAGAGGTFEIPAVEVDNADELIADFLISPMGLVAEHDRLTNLVEPLVGLGSTTGHKRAEYWGPERVRTVLCEVAAQELPDHLIYDGERFPELLKLWIAFVHQRTAPSAEVTLGTLRAVDEFEADFLERLWDREDHIELRPTA